MCLVGACAVKRVAVWVLMLVHIQAPHTDALKTHSLHNFLLDYCKLKKYQFLLGTTGRTVNIIDWLLLRGKCCDRELEDVGKIRLCEKIPPII